MPIPQLAKKIHKDWEVKKIRSLNSWRRGGYLHSPKRKKSRIFKKIIFILIALFFLGGVFVLGLFGWYSRDLPNPDRLLERAVAQSTKIYDRTGQTLLYEIHGEQRRTMVNLEQLPEYVKWATIVTEDKDFYQHSGFDFKRMVKAAIVDILRGQKVQGASTITQQFVKNTILTPEKTFTRKIKELILSYQIEKKFTKDQILKMYINEIPYGSTAYGIEAASQSFLGKSAKDLTLGEAAVLAALPKAPSYYLNHQDQLLSRQKSILETMVKEGYITQEESEKAKQEKIKFLPKRESIIAPHFVMYIKELLSEKYGERVAEEGGLKVYTTIDVEKQKIAEETITKYAKQNQEKYNASNAALVCLDAKTGEILSMVGSEDYFNDEIDGQVNVALMPRQPGSSFKPVVYTAAFKKGYTPETILFDLKTNFAVSGKPYTPEDYDGKERGPVTMRQALAGSLNIPGVQTLYLAGLGNVLSLAQKMGYTTLNTPERYGLSLVLGGGEVKLLEHVSAFSTFSQDGIYRPTKAILKIEDNQGRTIEQQGEDNGKRIFAPQIARLTNSILSDNDARSFIFGKKNNLTLDTIPVAAKTGTTNDFKDGWTIGFTPSLVTGVWAGNNDNSSMAKGADGVNVAAPIWHDFMQEILKDKPGEDFIPPEPEEVDKPILKGEWKNKITVKIDKASGKLASLLTPSTFIEEKTYEQVHNILYYVNKDDPRGPMPENPENDPQYPAWEAVVQKWIKDKNISLQSPPNEIDNLHQEGDKPSIEITSPENGYILSGNIIRVSSSASAKRGVISRVEYFFDDQFIGSSTTPPFLLEAGVINIKGGSHLLGAIAYDDIDNNNEARIDIFTSSEGYQAEQPTISWIQPKNNSSFSLNELPITIFLSVYSPFSVDKIKFYSLLGQNNPFMFGMITSPKDLNNLKIDWSNIRSAGTYKIYAEIIDQQGNSFPTKSISVSIY